MEKQKSMTDVVQIVAESKVWYLFSRDVSLNYCRMATKHFVSRGDTAKATEVFETLGLDLFTLSQIFVAKPHEFYTVPRQNRGVQPIASNYKDLGLCRTEDEDGWVALSKLVNKEIRLILGESAGKLVRIYYPSGEVKKIEWYHRFLNLVDEEIEDVRWYHRWIKKIVDIFSGKQGLFFLRKGKRAKSTL